MKDERKVGTLRAASGNKFLVVYGRTQHAASLQARGEKEESGKVNQGSTISKLKTGNCPPPPSLRSSSHLSQGNRLNGKVKTENYLTLSPTFSPWDRGEYPAGGRGWIK